MSVTIAPTAHGDHARVVNVGAANITCYARKGVVIFLWAGLIFCEVCHHSHSRTQSPAYSPSSWVLAAAPSSLIESV